MPSFGGGTISTWVTGTWTTELLDVSLLNKRDVTNEWTYVQWNESNTSDEGKAYVRVDILNSSGTVLQSNLSGAVTGGRKKIVLSDYATVKGVDIYIKFKLYGKGLSPIIDNIEVK